MVEKQGRIDKRPGLDVIGSKRVQLGMELFQFIPNGQVERSRAGTKAFVYAGQGIVHIPTPQILAGFVHPELTAVLGNAKEQRITPEQFRPVRSRCT
jgi:hypothetical protein